MATLFVALKRLFIVMTCVMAAALVYLYVMDRFSSCFNPSAWWMQVLETDVITYFLFITLFKLSSEESEDPLYFVLARHQKRDITGHRKQHSMVIAKVIIALLGCYMLGILIYAFMIDGMPFHMEVLTPCMITGLIDIHIHVVVFSVWIIYKESSWISSVFWILSVVCFGSMALCVYIARELLHLSPEQPVSFILFNQSSRDMMSSDPLLTEHSDV
uniref:uncharacterized protein LOC122595935 n=1 Tax=Erigeron canadensis TaxID=72917 RepID=UPI001CB98327|nr:uncharacterized protein LOC122595935 [Erigeron canadensis]